MSEQNKVPKGNLKWLKPRHILAVAAFPAVAFMIPQEAGGWRPEPAEDTAPVGDRLWGGLAYPQDAGPKTSQDLNALSTTPYPENSRPSYTGWSIPAEGLGVPSTAATAMTPAEIDWEAVDRLRAEMRESFRKNGKFLISIYGNYGEPDYLLCESTYNYTVKPRDALERIARKAHVHYIYEGQGKYVDESSMARSIDSNNPGKMKRMGYELQAGVTLTLPRDGSCNSTFEMAREYEY